MLELCGLRRLSVEFGGRAMVVDQVELVERAEAALSELRAVHGAAWAGKDLTRQHEALVHAVMDAAYRERFGEPSVDVQEEMEWAALGFALSIDGCPYCSAGADHESALPN